MRGKILRETALYPRDNLKRMDILATAWMVSVFWYNNKPLLKPTDRGNTERVRDLHVADGSEGREFESRGRRCFFVSQVAF
jgi:hypothetical protein